MYGKSQERRRRQRVTRPPTFRVENEQSPDDTPQYFQISVNIMEARKLAWSNPHAANSYVIIVLGKKKFRSTIRKSMREPYYNECYVYELYASIHDLQQSVIWLAVMEPRCCAPSRLLGEATIDLGAIWAQPRHQVFHKWAQLTQPRDSGTSPVGFLKVDISIIFRGDMQVMPAIINQESVDSNLLLPTGSDQQRADYLITVYGAFGLPTGTLTQGDKKYGKPPSTFVRVTFSGLTVNTAVQHRNNQPTYSEQISIVEMFPNICQTIRFEVCSAEGCYNRVMSGTNLKLGQVSYDGENGFLPTFGPSLLHMYGTAGIGTSGTAGDDGPYHRGALLASLKTLVPYYQQGVRSTSIEPVAPIRVEQLWIMENFCIYCPILEVSMLDRRITGKVSGVAITIGEIIQDDRSDAEFFSIMSDMRSRKLHYTGSIDVMKCKLAYGYLNFQNGYPILQLTTRLPDFRFRMFRQNMVYGIVTDLESSISNVERRLKALEYSALSELIDELNNSVDDATNNIKKFLDIVQYAGDESNKADDIARHNSTELDQKQLSVQIEEMEKVYQQLQKRNKSKSSVNLMNTISKLGVVPSDTKKGIKIFLAEIKAMTQNLRTLIFKSSDGWPDVVLWLLNGGSRVAYARIPASEIIHSMIPEQCGHNCGKIQTLLLKPTKCPKHMNNMAPGCFCVAGKLELLLWMGLYKQLSSFEQYLPDGMTLKEKGPEMMLKTSLMVLECRVFVYKAKFNNILENSCSPLSNTYLRANILNSVKDTNPIPKTTTPIWNQTLRIQRMVFTSQEKLVRSPPVLLVEVYDSDLADKQALLGSFQVRPVVDDRPEFEHAPKLQWYEVQQGGETIGQVLMSVQLLQVPEKLLKTTIYSPVEESFCSPDAKDYNIAEETFETLPPSLIPKLQTYKVDVYWWGLRDVNITRKPCVVLEIDELTIKSDIICDKKVNSNFPNGKSSHFFEAPNNKDYGSSLNIRLFDSGTFGRSLFLGTNIVKNTNKYVVNWIALNDRQESLKSASIMSSDFWQVNHMTFVKKSSRWTEKSEELITNEQNRILERIKCKAKVSAWRRLFSRKEPAEEEYVLLPVYAKQKDSMKVAKKSTKCFDQKDWWQRYCSSTGVFSEEDFYNFNKITNLLHDALYRHPLCSNYATGLKVLTTCLDGTTRVLPLPSRPRYENREPTFLMTSTKIFDSELESQPEFSKFKDWCSSLKFYNGKKTGIPENDEQLFCGVLKMGIAIYSWPPPSDTVAVNSRGVNLNNGFFDDLPKNDPAQFLVRVYLIRGIDFKINDFTGKSDPYVLLTCGKKVLGDRNSFVRNSVNPVFGRMYEFRCVLPEDYLLKIALYDYDTIQPDELIGSTSIDLEDRIYTKHRASIGLAKEYNLTGPYKWRDSLKPSEILEELCAKNHLPLPIYPDSASVLINGIEYRDSETDTEYGTMLERKENICLSLLHEWHTLPVCGYHLVPEHVETRSLYNPDKPGSEQGKIQMWVDIFSMEADLCIPPPVDIAPRNAEHYELRLIIWDVRQLKFEEVGEGKKCPDIYVKAWIGAISQAQHTDLHRQSNGEGNFNWRMVFELQYQHVERKLIVKEKGPFTEYEEKVSPILVIQVMDTESTLDEDSLGTLMLNLNSLPRGEKQPHQCKIETMDGIKINLFSIKTIRAWWPLYTGNLDSDKNEMAGVIDLEMTLLPKEKALLMPVGLGRSSPHCLPNPQRATSTKIYYAELTSENLCRQRFSKLVLAVGAVFLLGVITMYWDIFTTAETNDWVK